jgi:hypothetical protein
MRARKKAATRAKDAGDRLGRAVNFNSTIGLPAAALNSTGSNTGLSHVEFCHAWRFDESSRRRPDPSVSAIALIAAARTLVSVLAQRPFFHF